MPKLQLPSDYQVESHPCPDNPIELPPYHENLVVNSDMPPPPYDNKIVPCCIRFCAGGWFITISVIIAIIIIVYSVCILLFFSAPSHWKMNILFNLQLWNIYQMDNYHPLIIQELNDNEDDNDHHMLLFQYQSAITTFIFLCVFVYICFRDNS
jgi:hypothetical protein